MKKSAQTIKKSKDTELQKRAENNITIISCSIILYALILFVIHSMFSSEATMAAAKTVRAVLIYAGLAAGMVIASYSAYKSNKSLMKYALMCFFVSISTVGILYGDPWGMHATVAALIAAFVFVCVYAALTDKKLYYSSKKVRTIFKSAIAVVYGALLAVVIFAVVKNALAINEALNRTYAPVGESKVESFVSASEPTDPTAPSEAISEN